MRRVYQSVCERAYEVGVTDGINDDISRIKQGKKPKESTGGTSSDETADQGQSAESQMSNIHKRTHAE